jgi:hypothetical protein
LPVGVRRQRFERFDGADVTGRAQKVADPLPDFGILVMHVLQQFFGG